MVFRKTYSSINRDKKSAGLPNFLINYKQKIILPSQPELIFSKLSAANFLINYYQKIILPSQPELIFSAANLSLPNFFIGWRVRIFIEKLLITLVE